LHEPGAEVHEPTSKSLERGMKTWACFTPHATRFKEVRNTVRGFDKNPYPRRFRPNKRGCRRGVTLLVLVPVVSLVVRAAVRRRENPASR
jgi:hypothetical protein